MRRQRQLVIAAERLCDLTHFITLHRPWLWVFPHCPLARLSFYLDDRWQTGVWE